MATNNLITLFDQLMEEGGIRSVPYSLGKNFSFPPALNVREFKDKYEISMTAPGIDGSKVKVELTEGVLSISYEDSTEKKEENKEESGEMIRQEYSEYVNFSRNLSLPKNIDEESIKANYKNGILKISIYKTPEAKPRSVNVSVE
jgi:HSP20 family protein